MKVMAITQKGAGKIQSDDRILIHSVILNNELRYFEDISPRIIAIADGVGGNDGGNLAAEFVCRQIQTMSAELDSLRTLNTELLSYSALQQGYFQMATTFSGICFGTSPKLFHIGNTRVYAFRKGYLHQLTTDHTTYQFLLQNGNTKEASKCCKSEIYRCFGGGSSRFFHPDVIELTHSDIYLLTSDGVHEYLDTDTLEALLYQRSDLIVCAQNIVQTALKNGSKDDISIILIDNT